VGEDLDHILALRVLPVERGGARRTREREQES
jgi:hypothetical protein